jgi:P-type conjugative transfer protein TrbL
MSNSAIITTTVKTYIGAFSGYTNQFLTWGKEFFLISVVISIVWMCLWNAFDKHSFNESMPKFIKEFFIISLFFTIMLFAKDWLGTLPKSADAMGHAFGLTKVDPSSIIDQGIAIANSISGISKNVGLLDKIYAAIILGIANVIVLFAFFSIALDVAITILTIYFFIAISGFSLSFAAFSFTRSIARKTLDIVVANSMKLATIYLIVAAGSDIFNQIASELKNVGEDFFTPVYCAVAASLLFWLIAKNIPSQVAKVFSDVVQETKGTDAAALAMATVGYAGTAVKGAQIAGLAASAAGNAKLGLAKVAGSAINNAASHFGKASAEGKGVAGSLAKAVTGAAGDAAKSVGGGLSDRFANLTEKLKGNPASPKDVAGFAARMHGAANAVKEVKPPKK